MVMPIVGGDGPDHDALVGASFGGLFVGEGATDLVAVLRGIRFSGWIAPPADGWTVVVSESGAGVVAAGRRGIVEVGALVAERTGARVLAVRVRRDRDLALVAWEDREEVARYWSDPSQEPGAAREVLSDPVGAEEAATFAAFVGRGDDEKLVEKLGEVLEEELDTDSVIESERLRHVLDLLGLPTWIVSAWSLPKDLPTGPATRSMTRLRAGRSGVVGMVLGLAPARWRRGRTPPPILDEPPRGDTPNLEYWML